MDRREFIGAGVALAGVTLAAKTASAGPAAAAAAKDPHAGHMMHGTASPLSDAAAACVTKGEACLQHCLGMYAMGDTTMAGCGKAVSDMLAAARALLALSLAGSKHTKIAAKLAADTAKDCEAECKKHTHDVCKACAECCAKLVAEAAKA